MSGRIRTIKPELLEDEKTAGLNDEEWRIFVSLFLVADDYGNCRANPEFLKSQIKWARQSITFRESLATLSRLSLVTLYRVRGQSYLHIANWEKHQKVDKPGKPRVPGQELAENEECGTDSRESLETVATVSRLTPTSDHDPEGDPEGSGALTLAPPTPKPKKPRGTKKVPDDWQPTAEHHAIAAAQGVSFELELQRFRVCVFRRAYAPNEWNSRFSSWLLDKSPGGSTRRVPEPQRYDPYEEARRLRAEENAQLGAMNP